MRNWRILRHLALLSSITAFFANSRIHRAFWVYLLVSLSVAAGQDLDDESGSAATGNADPLTKIQAIRLVGDDARTRIVADLSRDTEFSILRLREPYRLVVDIADAVFGFGPDLSEGRGLVTAYRYGLVGPGMARIVLDLSGPVTVVQSFRLPPAENQPVRLVLDIAPGTEEAFARAANRGQQTRLSNIARKGDRLKRQRAASTPVVVIDPGHGGIDTGAAVSSDLVEKNLTLAFSQKLADVLNQNGKVEAILTRKDDSFVSLAERVKVARINEAGLFVSVHADIVPQSYVRGATVYTVSDEASDALAARMAERENRSDILAGMEIEDQTEEVADILFDLARRETKNLSVRFARTLIKDIKPQLVLNKSPWRRGAFMVLKAPDVPSVLFELGYISNKHDQELIRSEEWQLETAKTTATAIERFLVDGPDIAGQ